MLFVGQQGISIGSFHMQEQRGEELVAEAFFNRLSKRNRRLVRTSVEQEAQWGNRQAG